MHARWSWLLTLILARKWFEPRSMFTPWLKKIIWAMGVLRRTVVCDISTTCAEVTWLWRWPLLRLSKRWTSYTFIIQLYNSWLSDMRQIFKYICRIQFKGHCGIQNSSHFSCAGLTPMLAPFRTLGESQDILGSLFFQ